MKSYMGDMVERLAKDYIKINRIKIIKEIYPDQSDFTDIDIVKIDTKTGKGIGAVSGHNNNKTVHGWHGDLAIILHDAENGKRAIIFEIKFGKSRLSRPQAKFFMLASTNPPDEFMHKLKDLKIFMFHCSHLDLAESTINMAFHEYIHPNDRDYFKPKPIAVKTPVTKKMKKSEQKKKRRVIDKKAKKRRKKNVRLQSGIRPIGKKGRHTRKRELMKSKRTGQYDKDW